MKTATIPHTVGVEPITDLLRRIRPSMPREATVAVVQRNGGGYVWPHFTDLDLDLEVRAADLAEQLGARLLNAAGKPVPEQWPPAPKPGVCPDCLREKPITASVGSSWRGNLCPCKAKAGAR